MSNIEEYSGFILSIEPDIEIGVGDHVVRPAIVQEQNERDTQQISTSTAALQGRSCRSGTRGPTRSPTPPRSTRASTLADGVMAGTVMLELSPEQIVDEVISDRLGGWKEDEEFETLAAISCDADSGRRSASGPKTRSGVLTRRTR